MWLEQERWEETETRDGAERQKISLCRTFVAFKYHLDLKKKKKKRITLLLFGENTAGGKSGSRETISPVQERGDMTWQQSVCSEKGEI